MDTSEFLRANAKVINNHIVLGPIEEQRCCQTCFYEGNVVNVKFNSQKNGWECEKGHYAPNEGLASGTVVQGPNW